jgi:hypothetical protein
MSDDHVPSDGVDPADGTPAATRPPAWVGSRRRHLTVLGIAVVGIVIGTTLVVTGRNSPERATATTVVTVRGPLLPDLGEVPDQTAAKALLGHLDPHTLAPTATTADGPSTTGSTGTTARGPDLSEAGLQRCQQAIAQQSTDRSLGSRLAAGRLQVGRQPTFVVSYDLPASGSDPAGARLVLVDARTCRVLGAVDH